MHELHHRAIHRCAVRRQHLHAVALGLALDQQSFERVAGQPVPPGHDQGGDGEGVLLPLLDHRQGGGQTGALVQRQRARHARVLEALDKLDVFPAAVVHHRLLLHRQAEPVLNLLGGADAGVGQRSAHPKSKERLSTGFCFRVNPTLGTPPARSDAVTPENHPCIGT